MTGQTATQAWHHDAACARLAADAHDEDREYVHEQWWPSYTKAGRTVLTPETIRALQVCNGTGEQPGCPVRLQCLAEGMAAKFGVWGGLLPEEREAVRRRRLRQARKQHREAVGTG